MKRTVLYDRHVAAGARLVDFSGWEMPVQYPNGILHEHLTTRKHAGVFDVSHMGRFFVTGPDAISLLQNALTNDAESLVPGRAQYTILSDENGHAIDDAYLYRFHQGDSFLLVVNASNRERDYDHLKGLAGGLDVELSDASERLAMISVQGPDSTACLAQVLGELPALPNRNDCATVPYHGTDALLARTGYAGEPCGFELMLDNELAAETWDAILAAGANPIGLGARDTLRLEACLPLYGHEFGDGPDGAPMPIFACPLARFAVSFSSVKGDFLGRDALWRQAQAAQAAREGNPFDQAILPRRIRPLALLGKGIARAGAEVLSADSACGWVTSGTMIPYWEFVDRVPGESSSRRALALALLDAHIPTGTEVVAKVRGREIPAKVVRRFVNNRTGRYCTPEIC